MAPKEALASGNKTKASSGASPKQKTLAKKLKTEKEEVPAAEEQVAEEQELEAEEAAKPTIEEAEGAEAVGEGPAQHTSSKGANAATAAATAAKKTAATAAANLLPQPTMVDILLADHRDTMALFTHFEEVSRSGDKLLLEKLTDAIALTIRLHSQAEFEVLYPAMEKLLGGKGKEGREHAEQAHLKIEEDLLKALELRKEGSKKLASTIKEAMDLFVEHMGHEENELVPQMLKNLSEEEQVELGVSFMQAKATAPLTPQPTAT